MRACRYYDAEPVRDDDKDGALWACDMPYETAMILSVTQVQNEDGDLVFRFWVVADIPSDSDAVPPMKTRYFRFVDGRLGQLSYVENLVHLKTVHLGKSTVAVHCFQVIPREDAEGEDAPEPPQEVAEESEPADDDDTEPTNEEEEEPEAPDTIPTVQVSTQLHLN